MAGILVYALHDDEGNFNNNSLGAISEAAKLAGSAGGEAAALVVGEIDDAACAGLGKYGATKVYRAKSVPEGLAQPIVDAMAKVMTDNGISYALFGGGLLGFEIGAGLTARLNAGVTMEVTAVKAEGDKLIAERPVLQDSAIVDVGYVGEPGIIIGRLNAFDIAEGGDGAAEVVDVDVQLEGHSTKAVMVQRGEQRGADVNIEDADILVAGGRGLGKAEGFEMCQSLAKEFVGEPTDPEDERIEVGVVIVGGGPGGLACAIRLTQLLAEDEALMESLGEVPVALVEKGKGPGSHLLSGAMLNPSAMRKLFPDLDESDWPTYGAVDKDAVYLLPNSKRAIPLKPTPPPFRNHGNHVTSVAQLGRWLSQQTEEAGVYILGETTGHRLLVDDGRVVGVRSGDKGRGRDGQELSNFEPGSDLIGKATVLAEGTAGHLTGAAIRHFDIGSEDPQQWELGVKEVWEVQEPLDRVIHTMGWPLRFAAKYREFGGSFIYPMGEDKVSLGLVVGLDYRDATFSPHDAFQELKTPPMIAD